MSVIVTRWICENCKSEFRNYVSFGEPVEDFDFQWKCGECGHENIYHVSAFPWFSSVRQRSVECNE